MVSVIIPTYNGSETIQRCIKSVQSQGVDVEIIICDDCSVDGTVEIARGMGCKIIWNEEHTGGPNRGRNMGILNSTGKYIAFIDQDDEWLPGKLKAQLFRVETLKVEVVYSQYEGAEKPESPDIYQTLLERDSRYGWPYMSSLFMRKKDIPLFEEYFGFLDHDWLLRLFKNRTSWQTHPYVKRGITGKNLSRSAEYRRADYYMGMYSVDGDVRLMNRWTSSRARYHYVMGEMILARYFFLRGEINWKTVLYYLTSFNRWLSGIIVKRYKVFG